MFEFTEGIWVTIAFFTLLFLVAKPIKRIFLSFLDKYISDTSATLKEAQELKREAEARLDSAKNQLEESRKLAASILKRSEEEAVSIVQDAQVFAKEEAKKQVSVIASNFEARKQKLFAEIKEQAVDKAMASVVERFGESADPDEEAALLEFGISEFKKTVH